MNGFLVLLVHTMDDLPVYFADKEVDAMVFAKNLLPDPPEAVRLVFNTDCSTPVCVKVVRFSNGMPQSVEVVKDFTRESESMEPRLA